MNDPSRSTVPADHLEPLAAFDDWPGVSAANGFLGRRGGVSRGAYAELNLSPWVGDEPTAVEENWRRVLALLPPSSVFALLRQKHGKTVHVVDERYGAPLEGDGMVTARAGVILGVFTADCVPVLLIDARHKVVGALHAGWRGTLEDIAAEGVSAMTAAGAQLADIRAALGPSIGPCCFEVDANLAERFAREVVGAAAHTRAGRPGKAFLDLRAIVRRQLETAGLRRGAIASVGPCTRCAAGRFFSRRAAGGIATGLELSYVGFAA